MSELTADRLREVLEYDPETGIFRWQRVTRCGVSAGAEAGCNSRGYRTIRVDGKMYLAHRLAWLYAYGVWPAAEIDHKNGVRNDNRLSNIRNATRRENARNREKNSTKSGYKGVTRNGKGFKAEIGTGLGNLHLGYFREAHHAAAAYRIAAAAVFGDFARK